MSKMPMNDDEEELGELSSTTESQRSQERSRDEEEEIRKLSQKETTRVRTWRIMVFFALLVTAVSVTVTTFILLKQQEHENFENVYNQFARTVADSAIAQQRSLHDALKSMSDTMSELATLAGGGTPNWPYFIPNKYETFAQHYKNMSSAEFVGITNVVPHDQRESFSRFMDENYEEVFAENHMIRYGTLDFLDTDPAKYSPYITKKLDGKFVEDDVRDSYIVRTIQSPPPRAYGPSLNWNLASDPGFAGYMNAAISLRNETTYSEIRQFIGLAPDEHKGFHSIENDDNPHAFGHYPVFKVAGDQSSGVVAVLVTAIAYDASMMNLLPENVKGMLVVLENTCGQTFSYIIDGKEAIYQDMDDLHDRKYDDFAVDVNLAISRNEKLATTPGHCLYTMKIYPTQPFEDDYKTNTPAIYAGIVAVTFVVVAFVFLVYDTMVLKRNEKMIHNAAQTNAIVTSFVPDHLRDRLIHHQELEKQRKQKGNLKTFLNDGTKRPGGNHDNNPSDPLADLFLETTVVFADISGFTAWSSVRDPKMVFVLLETLYGAFDRIAKKRRIFKVETVGDCYVAVTGLPEPRKDHAVAMARFASDILNKMYSMTKELEVTLGPDTGELALRIGMHSGPVTAGVLRGERARFQLFGDTMNTCARLESSSFPNRVQCSKETADLLIASGKEAWVKKRTEPMPPLKGKGLLEGFWVSVRGERAGSATSGTSVSQTTDQVSPVSSGCFKYEDVDERTSRLINWNVEMLIKLMQAIVARRQASTGKRKSSRHRRDDSMDTIFGTSNPLEEVREIIALPEFDVEAARREVDPEQVKIPDAVVQELRHLVSSIAKLYNNNPFHNFDHASHVVMSVTKLLSRIVAPSHLDGTAASLHDHTYGITSDPLTQFACAFSALIHDVDHVGVSNAQLVKEGVPIAKKYQRSVAEQNSLDISWDLLMRPEYKTLREYLFPADNMDDLKRFRQLVVNSIMSTDIVDKELKELRNERWDKAFHNKDDDNNVSDDKNDEDHRDEVNRKATIVIEHIIQASDVSHTMQHWHVYRKWNQNLFEELYVAYLNGRMEKSPVDFWYKGELGFFDFYIIPLTKKLKDCGVFGVSSGEYLDYALKNRAEWEESGEAAVKDLTEEAKKKYGVKGSDGRVIKNAAGSFADYSTSSC